MKNLKDLKWTVPPGDEEHLVTRGDIIELYSTAREFGWHKDAVKDLLKEWYGYTSSKQLTRKQQQDVLDYIEKSDGIPPDDDVMFPAD